MNRGLPSQPEQICAFAEPSDDERRGGLCLYQWSRKWGRCFTSSERINHASILPTPNHLTRERRPHSMLGTENADLGRKNSRFALTPLLGRHCPPNALSPCPKGWQPPSLLQIISLPG